MKNLSIFAIALMIITVSSCTTVQRVGDLNMVSNRNVDSQTNYVLIKNYVGGSKKELKKARYTSMEDAVDAVVRTTTGGEFMKNAKVYLIRKGDKKVYFAVEGDVWGISGTATK